jgi:hypothetical protein
MSVSQLVLHDRVLDDGNRQRLEMRARMNGFRIFAEQLLPRFRSCGDLRLGCASKETDDMSQAIANLRSSLDEAFANSEVQISLQKKAF